LMEGAGVPQLKIAQSELAEEAGVEPTKPVLTDFTGFEVRAPHRG